MSDVYKFEHDLEILEELLECLRELELRPNDPQSMARMQMAVDTVSVFIPGLEVADRALAEQMHNTCVELGEMYLKSKRFDESKAVLLEGLRRQPTSGRAWIVLAESLLAKGDAEGSIEAAELGLSHLRDDVRGVEILGDAYVEIESLSAAVKAYSRLPKCRRGPTRLQWKLAKAYRQMNELEKAMEEYREVSFWRAEISDVHYEIGTLWARIYGGDEGAKIPYDIENAERAARSDDPTDVFRTGLGHIAIGQLSLAEKRAEELKTSSPELSGRLTGWLGIAKEQIGPTVDPIQF